MADINGLLNDPRFGQLSPVDQRKVLGRIDPAFNHLTDAQLSDFRQRMQPAPSASASAPGFWQELWDVNGQPLVNLAQQALHSPWQAAKGVVSGLWQGQAQQGHEAWQALTGQGNYAGMTPMERASSALGHGVATVLPVLGPAAAHAADNLGAGNWGAGAADVLSLAGQMYAPEAGEAVGRVPASAAEGMYRSALPFKRSLSLEDMKAATRYGLEEGLPRSEASLKALGSVAEPGTLLGDLERQVQTALDSGQRGSLPVDLTTAVKPLEDEIARASLDKTSEGRQYVQSLKQELQEWQQQYPSGLTVEQAQAAKRAMYDRISASQYADNSNAIPTASRIAKEQLARGLKDAVNERVPEVAALNERMGTAIDLRQALTDAAKQAPSNFRNQLTWALGGGSAMSLALGHEAAGVTGLIATAAKLALDSPAARSRIAIAFQRSPQVLRALGYAEQGSWAAAPHSQ